MDQPIDKKGKKRILRFSKSGIPLHMLDDIQIQELDPECQAIIPQGTFLNALWSITCSI